MRDRRTAIVTGAAGGIGAAVVTRLVARGALVAALDRDESALAELMQRAGGDDSIVPICVDLCDSVATRNAVDQIVARTGRLDALVTSAGVFAQTPALRVDPAIVDRVLDTNLKSVLQLTAACAPHMAERRYGRIVHVSSIAAETGAALAASYAASKAGVVAITRSHARELAPLGISVVAVLPGYTNTKMAEPVRALVERFVLPRAPLKRIAEPDEVAEVIEFFATCDTQFVTGASITLDGGLHVG